MALIDRLLAPRDRSISLTIDDYLARLGMGLEDGLVLRQTLTNQKVELPDSTYSSLASQIYGRNAVVFACISLRISVFAQAVFKFRNVASGDLFGNPTLDALEHPWTNATTGDLLARALLDVDLAGNSYWARRGDQLRRLRPDWVTIFMGSNDGSLTAWDIDADVLAYGYQPGGPAQGRPLEILDASEVAHFAPYPDPLSPFRGMPWLSTVLTETVADRAATIHKARFFENGATPNMVVSLDASIQKDAFTTWVEAFEKNHKGVKNAYKTLYLGAGAKADVVGTNMQQLDFSVTQSAGERRIAGAAGVPLVLVMPEGAQAETYYPAARRRFADGTITFLLQNFCGSFETIVPPPGGAQLWFDPSRIPFFREDVKDAAEIVQIQMNAIGSGIKDGWEPDATVQAVMAGDPRQLIGNHSGFASVQLQPPPAALPNVTPVPQIPAVTPTRSLEAGVRCPSCGKLVARSLGVGSEIDCPRCKTLVVA